MEDEGIALLVERRKRGLKQYELAALIGINPSAISNYERGSRPIEPRIRRRLVELGFPIKAEVLAAADGREVFRI